MSDGLAIRTSPWSLLLTLAVLGFSETARAQNTAPSAATPSVKAPAEDPQEFSRVRGLFDVDLPQTVEKFQAKLLVHPHFGDFLHRGYVRVPVGVRLGVSERTEINAEAESYLTHGFKRQHVGYGLDRLSLGAKHQWAEWLHPIVDTSTGFNFTEPVGRPPLDLTDGFRHLSTYITFSRRLPQHPRLVPFVTLATDLMWKSHVPGSFQKNEPHSDSLGTSAGFLLDRDQFKYTLVCSYWTTAWIGRGSKSFVSINPSVLWDLPPWLKFHSKGQWIFGVGVKANVGPDGTDFGTSAKLRGEFKFSRLASFR